MHGSKQTTKRPRRAARALVAAALLALTAGACSSGPSSSSSSTTTSTTPLPGAPSGSASSSTSSTTTPASGTTTTSAPSFGIGSANSTTTIAFSPNHVGGTQSLAQTTLNPPMQVTLMLMLDPAQTIAQLPGPNGGDRYVGVRLRITTSGSSTFTDDPWADAIVSDAQGHLFSAAPAQLQNCSPLATGGVTISPNRPVAGCVTFLLPLNATITQVQYTPGGANYGGATATWQVP